MSARAIRGPLSSCALCLGILAGCGDQPTTSGRPTPASGGNGGGAGETTSDAGAHVGGAQTTTSGSGNTGVDVGGVDGNGTGGASGGGLPATSGSAGTGASGMGGTVILDCPAVSSEPAPWPGKNEVKTLDTKDQFKSDLSGLTYEPGATAATGVLWAVNNLSGTLFRLVQSGNGFVPDTANGWSAGKALHYPGGSGAPDAEGVTFGANVADGVYVCAEHDGTDSSTSRMSVLRYDVSGAGAVLTASHEWNVTSLLPKVGANAGLEAITWVPDSFLTARGFFDGAKAHAYAPAEYASHGSGLFFVGVEATGKLHVLALNHADSTAALVATIAAPNPGVMGLEFDRDAGNLWFSCDEGCDNASGVLDIDTKVGSATLGRFVVRRQFQRPSSLPNSNNEGIATAPGSECNGGFKRFFWTDDADEGDFSLRTDLLPCARCL